MNPREFRVGNYVEYNNASIGWVVYQLSVEDFKYLENGNFRPIKISKKLLKKLDFESWGTVTSNNYESYERFVIYNLLGTSNYEVHVVKSTYGGKEVIEYVTSIDSDERQYNWRMDFLHDLQNACYKETGKELLFIKKLKEIL